MNSKLFIILVNYNGYRDTIECVESLLNNKEDDIHIIIVDNSASDEYAQTITNWANGNLQEEIITKYPEFVFPLSLKPLDFIYLDESELKHDLHTNKLILIKAKENNGFAAANNIGLQYVQSIGQSGDMIWILNNDTVLSKNAISQIKGKLKIVKQEQHQVLFGTPLLEYDSPKIIQAIGGKYNRVVATTSHVGAGYNVEEKIDVNDFNVNYPIGASMLLSFDLLERIGLMNEEYFLFYEEVDWVSRLKKIKGEVKILDFFGVYHKQGNTTKHKTNKFKSEFMDLLSIRNRIILTKKYYKTYIWSLMLSFIIITIPKRLLQGNIKRVSKIIILIFKTYFEKERKSI